MVFVVVTHETRAVCLVGTGPGVALYKPRAVLFNCSRSVIYIGSIGMNVEPVVSINQYQCATHNGALIGVPKLGTA